jgi:hypothetical protein
MNPIRQLIAFLVLFLLSITTVHAQSWQYSQNISVSKKAEIRGLTLDSDTNLYVTAFHREDATVIGPSGTTLFPTAGKQDILLMKLSHDGDTLWTKSIYGTDSDYPRQVKLDNSGNPYITGIYKSDSLYIQGKYLKKPVDTDYDIFLSQYGADGSNIFARRVAHAPKEQYVDQISIDNNNNIYMTGSFVDSIYFDSDTLFTATANQKYLFLAKFKPNGDFTWAKSFPLTTSIIGNFLDVSVVQDTIVYMSGFFTGDLTIDGTTISSQGDADDIVLAKVDSSGSLIWVKQAGSNGTADRANGLVIDESASAYITGYFSETADFDGTQLQAASSLTDMFVAKYNRSGSLIWVTRNGGLGADIAYGAKLTGNILQTSGYFSDSVSFNSMVIRSNGLSDLNTGFFIYDTDGNPITAVSIDGSIDNGADRGEYIESLLSNYTYIGGYYESDTLFIGDDTLKSTASSNSAFIAKCRNSFSATFSETKHVSCLGGNDGYLKVTGYFGVEPYTYDWGIPISDSTTASVSGLSKGLYYVTVKDANNDSILIYTTITEPTALNTTLTPTHLSCFQASDGEIETNATGGTAPYTYAWTGPEEYNSTAEDPTGISAGEYSVIVTDNNLCEVTKTVEITQPERITSTATVVPESIGLSNGEIDVTISGGKSPYTYTWEYEGVAYSGSSNSLTGLAEGQYTIYVEDDDLCPYDTSIIVSGITLKVNLNGTDAVCYGDNNGTLEATIEFGFNASETYTYEFKDTLNTVLSSGSSASLSNLTAGKYYVTLHEEGTGATSIDSFRISQPDSIAITFTPTDALCYEGNTSITASITGGITEYTYSWSNGQTSQNLSGVPAGKYTLTVTDNHLCQKIDSSETIEPDSIKIILTEYTPITCFGDSDGVLQASVSGGTGSYNYSWNDASSQDQTQAINLSDGTYTVTVTDDNSCINTHSFTLLEPAAITFASIDSTNISCAEYADGSIEVTMAGGTGAYTYNWSHSLPNSSLVENLAVDTYTLTVSDDNNCLSDEQSIEINGPATALSLEEDISSHVNNACFGDSNGSLTLIASDGWTDNDYQYSLDLINWSTSPIFSGLNAQNYTTYVRDDNNCVESISVEITEPDEIIINSETVDDKTIMVTATGGTNPLSYSLDGTGTPQSTGQFNDLANGSYFVAVTDINTCGPAVSNNLTIEPSGIDVIENTVSQLYPNPSNGQFNLLFKVPNDGEFMVELFSLNGVKVFEEAYIAYAGETKNITIDVSKNTKGLYVIKVNGVSLQTKLIIE